MLDKFIDQEFGFKLSPQQLAVIQHLEGPALVLACPGSGKTSTLLFRTFHLVYNMGIPPENILSMTFSRAAANDMRKKFNIFNGYMNKKVRFSTIHSFAYGVLKTYYPRVCGQNFEILGDKKTKLLKELYMEVNNEMINDDKLEELENTIGYFKNTLVKVEDFDDYNIDIPAFKEIFIRYGQYKRKNHLIDYDDMLTITLWLFQKYSKILDIYRNKYQYIQVDEAQDTSKIQHEIIKLLAKPQNNLFMVGDDDQSIYSWRGANVEFLLNFKEEFKNSKIYYMEQNFRSTKDIIDISSKSIKHNSERFDKKMHTSAPYKRAVKTVSLRNHDDQITYMINKLKSIENLRDSAVLFRKNISVIPLIDALERNDIPFYIRDHKNSFFTHFAVRDMISFLKLAIDHTDTDAFSSICFKTNAYISKAMIKHFEQQSSGSIFHRLKSNPQLSTRQIKNINHLEKGFKTLKTKSPSAAISFILLKMGYKDSLETYCKKFGYSIDHAHHIISALSLIAENTTSIIEFLVRRDRLEEILKNSTKNWNNNAVTLSTLHSSKGLEFQNVLIYDLLQDEFPSGKAVELYQNCQPSELEEERRLFYVGMTRSKEYLDLITINGRESQFIQEIRGYDQAEIKPGDIVYHPAFGKGYIQSVDSSTYVVKFENHGIKKLNKQVVQEKNLLNLACE